MVRRCLRFVLALAAILTVSPASAETAEVRAFQGGPLISADPVAQAPAGMRAWRIRYRTTGPHGVREVTGMVVVPQGKPPRLPRRVILWTHGTWGVTQRCAPSLSANFFAATPGLAEAIRRGYAVVAPDYPGLGGAGVHPFLIGRETAWSALDAVNAAQTMPEAAVGRRIAVWGESQGGHAALWTAAEAKVYAPALEIAGTVAAAPPTDLVANLRDAADPNARALMTAFVAHSWSRRYGAPLDTLFNRVNQGVVTRLAQNNCVELSRKPRLGTILGLLSVRQALRGKDIGAIEPWARIARENSLDPRMPFGPLMITQGEKDALVAPAVTRAFARGVCRNGGRLHYVGMPGGDHAGAARSVVLLTLDWIDARFSGAPPPSDCAKL